MPVPGARAPGAGTRSVSAAPTRRAGAAARGEAAWPRKWETPPQQRVEPARAHLRQTPGSATALRQPTSRRSPGSSTCRAYRRGQHPRHAPDRTRDGSRDPAMPIGRALRPPGRQRGLHPDHRRSEPDRHVRRRMRRRTTTQTAPTLPSGEVVCVGGTWLTRGVLVQSFRLGDTRFGAVDLHQRDEGRLIRKLEPPRGLPQTARLTFPPWEGLSSTPVGEHRFIATEV
jgi:hypothetical protein